jgi:antitoxin StbD
MSDHFDNLVPVTEAKARLPELVRLAGENRATVLLRHGRPAALLLGVAAYEALLEEIEDLQDRLSVYESREHGVEARMPFEKVLVELGIET